MASYTTNADDQLALKLEDLLRECRRLEFENSVWKSFFVREKQDGVKGRAGSMAGDSAKTGNDDSRNGTVCDDIPKMSGEDLQALLEFYDQDSQYAKELGTMLNVTDNKLAGVVSAAMNEQRGGNSKSIPVSLLHLERPLPQWKCRVLLVELEGTRVDQTTNEYETMKKIDQLSVQQEEASMRVRDHQKMHCEFTREAKANFDESKETYNSDFIHRFFTSTLHLREGLKSKLRLRHSTTAHQISKVVGKIKHKEEISDDLNVVDLEQLKFENQQFQEQINCKNQELHDLKLQCGKFITLLNNMKDKMRKHDREIKQAKSNIQAREDIQKRLNDESMRVGVELCEVTERLHNLKSRTEAYRAPTVSSYIETSMLLEKLQKQSTSWQRKLEIAKLTLKGVTSFWNKVCAKQRMIDSHERYVKKNFS